MASYLVYQLTGGSEAEAAVHLAEVRGRSDAQLAQAVQALVGYEVEKQYINPETRTIIYSFVKHDTQRTRNFVIQVGSGDLPGTLEANRLVTAVLANAPLAVFLIQADDTLAPAVITEPGKNLAHLAPFYLT